MVKAVGVSKGVDSSGGNGHLPGGKVRLPKGKNLEEIVSKEYAKCAFLFVDNYNPEKTNFFFVKDKVKVPLFFFLERCARGSKHFVGSFEFPGGKVEKKEERSVALLRELYEETNIDLHFGFASEYKNGYKPKLYSSKITIGNKKFGATHSYYGNKWSSLIPLKNIIELHKGRFFPYLLIADKSLLKEIKLSEEHGSSLTLSTDHAFMLMHLNKFYVKSKDSFKDKNIDDYYAQFKEIIKNPKEYDKLSNKEKDNLSDLISNKVFAVPNNTSPEKPIHFVPTTIHILGQALEYLEKINNTTQKLSPLKKIKNKAK